MDQEKIGKFIVKLRNKKGLTQTELGNLLGVSNKSVSKWENGICLPDPSLYNEVCKIFNISLDELFSGKRKIKSFAKTIICLVVILISFLVIYKLTSVKVYQLQVDNQNDAFAMYHTGILSDGFFKDVLKIHLEYKNPENIELVGLYIKESNEYKLLDTDMPYVGNVTDDYVHVYSSDSIGTTEKYFNKQNYINKLIKNKDRAYICITFKNDLSKTDEQCNKIYFEEL